MYIADIQALGRAGAGATDAVHIEDTIQDYEDAVSDHRPIRVRFAGP
jgi:hypothetical protein